MNNTKRPRECNEFRNYRKLDTNEFKQHLEQRFANVDLSDIHVNDAVKFFEGAITATLDEILPVSSKMRTKRKLNPWFSENIKEQQKIMRRSEKK